MNDLIDKTERYSFERITQEDSNKRNLDNLTSFFIHKGKANLVLKNTNFSSQNLIEGQGFIVAPGTEYELFPHAKSIIYKVSSNVDPSQQIKVILDDVSGKKEVPLNYFRAVENPKKVVKPWGHELWISWNNYHVLKQIKMNAGNQSSLQFHREKLETNYLEKGKAQVIEGYKLNPTASEKEVLESSKGIDFNEYKKEMVSGMHWTSHPGTVHRVIAFEDYLAYEVSTPELDDVIRLQDDSNRKSGRISSEHKNE